MENIIYKNQKHNNDMPIYYVYVYFDITGVPYYVGKGHNNRAYNTHKYVNVPTDKKLIIIAESNLTELGAFALERRLISLYGRLDLSSGCLLNKTSGGGGLSGIIVSDTTKQKISKTLSGIKKPEHIKQKISKSTKGLKKSSEARSNISNSRKGLIHAATTKSKISASLRNTWANKSSEEKLKIHISRSENNPNSKLSTAQRLEMLDLKNKGKTNIELVDYFNSTYNINISINSISTICKRIKKRMS